MIKMNEEVYLQNLVFKKTYNDKGFVKGEIVFKNRISLEEYTNIQEKKDLILCDKLQNNWNELDKWLIEKLKEYQKSKYPGEYGLVLGFIWQMQRKVQELEQGKDE